VRIPGHRTPPHRMCPSHTGCAVDKLDQDTAEVDASLELERDIEEIDRALQEVPPDATVLPGVWHFACELHPLMAQLMPPADISAFCVACDSLQELQGNVLLLDLIAQVKYPSIVTEFAAMLATLPASFDAADVLTKCHSICRSWQVRMTQISCNTSLTCSITRGWEL